MRFDRILETAAKTLAKARLGGRKGDPKLAALDCGVLTVALLVAAIDGTVLPEEYAAFEMLAKKCRGGSAKNVRALLDAALPEVGRLMAMAQVGVYTEKERLEAFLAAASKALPHGFENGSLADLRRAFALWVMMGVSDGRFSSVEKTAVTALEWQFAAGWAKKTRKGGTGKAFRLLEADFLVKAEKIARELANASKKTKATAALEALIASVPTVDETGRTVLRPTNGIAVKLAAVAILGLAAVGSARAADSCFIYFDDDEMGASAPPTFAPRIACVR